MKTFWKRVLSCALIMFVCAATPMTKPSMAQSDDALNRPSGAQQFRLDPAELETFLDGLVGGRLEANNIAGATISIVHNGAVVLSKGYGYADAAERTPSMATRLYSVLALFQRPSSGRPSCSSPSREKLI